MKIGIITYRQFPYVSANTSIGYIIGENIARRDGYEVVFIGHKQDPAQNNVCEYKGIKIRYFNDKIPTKKSARIKNIVQKFFGDLAFLFNARKLRKIVKEEQIDALVCVQSPPETAWIAKRAKLKIPCYLYQLDPFHIHGDVENLKQRKQFLKLLKSFSGVFATTPLQRYYEREKDFQYLVRKGLVKECKHPTLVKPKQVEVQAIKKDKTRLVYGGTLYRGVRDPKILADLKKALSDDIEICFFGGCDNAQDFAMLKQTGVICGGRVSPERLQEEYRKADVLINIGNKIKMQDASKVVDYMALGKPILHIHQFADLTSTETLEKYPLKCCVDAATLSDGAGSDLVNTFINESKGKSVPYEKVEKWYEEYTPQYVADSVLEMINKK
ncbi:MAG: hypothetical protein IJV80_05935 [Clostridia bacterium]|nr:hypothetical protein [Clostridia bacterium]